MRPAVLIVVASGLLFGCGGGAASSGDAGGAGGAGGQPTGTGGTNPGSGGSIDTSNPLVATNDGITGIAALDHGVAFMEVGSDGSSSKLASVAYTGGQPTMIDTIPSINFGLVADGTDVAYAAISTTPTPLMEAEVASGKTRVLVPAAMSGSYKPLGIVGGDVYFSDGQDIYSVPEKGGAASASLGELGTACAVTESYMFSASFNHQLVAVPIGGGATTTVGTIDQAVELIAAAGDAVFWIDGVTTTQPMSLRGARVGKPVKTFATGLFNGLAADGANAYALHEVSQGKPWEMLTLDVDAGTSKGAAVDFKGGVAVDGVAVRAGVPLIAAVGFNPSMNGQRAIGIFLVPR